MLRSSMTSQPLEAHTLKAGRHGSAHRLCRRCHCWRTRRTNAARTHPPGSTQPQHDHSVRSTHLDVLVPRLLREICQRGLGGGVAQQVLGGHHHQRLAELRGGGARGETRGGEARRGEARRGERRGRQRQQSLWRLRVQRQRWRRRRLHSSSTAAAAAAAARPPTHPSAAAAVAGAAACI